MLLLFSKPEDLANWIEIIEPFRKFEYCGDTTYPFKNELIIGEYGCFSDLEGKPLARVVGEV